MSVPVGQSALEDFKVAGNKIRVRVDSAESLSVKDLVVTICGEGKRSSISDGSV